MAARQPHQTPPQQQQQPTTKKVWRNWQDKQSNHVNAFTIGKLINYKKKKMQMQNKATKRHQNNNKTHKTNKTKQGTCKTTKAWDIFAIAKKFIKLIASLASLTVGSIASCALSSVSCCCLLLGLLVLHVRLSFSMTIGNFFAANHLDIAQIKDVPSQKI